MKQWVLITGASQGIGHELAKDFAANGWQLILVARDYARLSAIAAELSARHGVSVKILTKDLARITSAQEIFEELKNEGMEISVLVNNAGFGVQGIFAETELQKYLDMAQVNITTLVQLTHLFLPGMLARRSGKILNVASTAAFLPGPYMAMYYASKAFVISFSSALSVETGGSGVTVTALCPGVTESEFHSRAGLKRNMKFIIMSAEAVAHIGYRAMMAGKPVVVAGWINWISVVMMKLMPAQWLSRIAAKVNGPAR
jgi:hypothetical protein